MQKIETGINSQIFERSNIHVRPLSPELVKPVVSLHLQAFPSFFLSSLGPWFLREFYSAFLSDAHGMAFVACNEKGEAVGAVVGSVAPNGFFKRLLFRKWWVFGFASLGAVVKKPSTLPRLARAVFYRGEAPSGPARALLSSIAVSPKAQGQGVGKVLIQAWIEEARRRGVSGCYLTTDAEANDSVNHFYRKTGWQLEQSFKTPERRKMNRYVLDFKKAV